MKAAYSGSELTEPSTWLDVRSLQWETALHLSPDVWTRAGDPQTLEEKEPLV